ncbi:hypothetical protein OAA15_00630 [bacterium]|nr:hypothetical protein [bacterium]
MIEFDSFMDFTKSVEDRDIDFITQIVDRVIDAVDNNKDKIVIFSTPDIFGDEILSFTVNKDQYKYLLKRALTDFEKAEQYEYCIKINRAINQLTK